MPPEGSQIHFPDQSEEAGRSTEPLQVTITPERRTVEMVSPPPISRVTEPDLPTTGAAIAHGGERNGDSGARQPPATMSVTPLPSRIVQPESSDLIWPRHPDARA